MPKIILISIAMLLWVSCKKRKTIYIEDFTSQNVWSKSNDSTKSIYFLVSGYTGHDDDYGHIEDHLCRINRDSLDNLYNQFWINYYQKSNKTNNENIRDNPKDFFRYSTFEDQIAGYSFIADTLVLRRKYYLNEYPKKTDHFKEYELCK